MKPECVVIDIDGTLSDCADRRRFLEQENPDWKSFLDTMTEDRTNKWCVDLIEALRIRYDIVLCSGRPSEFRKRTEMWLTFHGVHYDTLLMRAEGDSRQDAIVKEEILKKDILPKWDILFVVDDRKQVVDMWRKNGIVCLQCAEGNF